MLDRLPAAWRHFLIGLLAAILAVVADQLPLLNLPPTVGALVGAVVGYVLLYITPLVRQYGVGSRKADPGDDEGL